MKVEEDGHYWVIWTQWARLYSVSTTSQSAESFCQWAASLSVPGQWRLSLSLTKLRYHKATSFRWKCDHHQTNINLYQENSYTGKKLWTRIAIDFLIYSLNALVVSYQFWSLFISEWLLLVFQGEQGEKKKSFSIIRWSDR